LKVSINDILNNNNGLDRVFSNSYISQNSYTTIKRYGLFSVIWNFNRNK
jgi:hypothetical protein